MKGEINQRLVSDDWSVLNQFLGSFLNWAQLLGGDKPWRDETIMDLYKLTWCVALTGNTVTEGKRIMKYAAMAFLLWLIHHKHAVGVKSLYNLYRQTSSLCVVLFFFVRYSKSPIFPPDPIAQTWRCEIVVTCTKKKSVLAKISCSSFNDAVAPLAVSLTNSLLIC